jgi:hypothetical protein
MTIISRSSFNSSLNSLFGVKNLSCNFDTDCFKILSRRAKLIDLRQIINEQYLQSPVNHPGYDGRAIIEDLVIYTQTKIAKSSIKDNTIRSKSIINIISEHIKFHKALSLENVHIIFYEWGCIDEVNPMKIKQEIILELKKIKNKPKEVTQFVNKFGLDNIHVVNRLELENWLLPSFLPVAYFATITSHT